MILDRRLNAFRPDLAERGLEGLVEAKHFVDGQPARVIEAVVGLRPVPKDDCGIDTQLLFGERVSVLDRKEGWAWVKAELDSYVGYVEERALGAMGQDATHLLHAPRSFAYREPDLKRPVARALSMGSRLVVTGSANTRGTDYLLLDDHTAVIASHCRPIADDCTDDHAAVAARLLETPYLWGGRSAFGIDCSGLVQMCLMMRGYKAPRDSDMQANGLGKVIDAGERKRGDLVFWKGHAAILEDRDTVIHANGHTMSVARESLDDAISRIRPVYGEPTVWRRP
jgi:cell wall-associated NlpC family hydrolase